MEIYRHKKGGIYRVLTRMKAPYSAKEGDRIPVQYQGRTYFAAVQSELRDQKHMTVFYQCLLTDTFHLRAAEEFDDPQRFKRVA